VTRSTTALCSLALVLVWLGSAGSLFASTSEFKVIVHPENHAVTLSRDFLSAAFLKTAVIWNDGKPIRPIDLPVDSPARESFTREVLKKGVGQLKNYWTQRIFSGTGVPPPQAASTAAAISYVLANPGALAYVPADVDPGGARVVPVR
jgi:ABC-type phosphate transport system substrate-binding protein